MRTAYLVPSISILAAVLCACDGSSSSSSTQVDPTPSPVVSASPEAAAKPAPVAVAIPADSWSGPFERMSSDETLTAVFTGPAGGGGLTLLPDGFSLDQDVAINIAFKIEGSVEALSDAGTASIEFLATPYDDAGASMGSRRAVGIDPVVLTKTGDFTIERVWAMENTNIEGVASWLPQLKINPNTEGNPQLTVKTWTYTLLPAGE